MTPRFTKNRRPYPLFSSLWAALFAAPILLCFSLRLEEPMYGDLGEYVGLLGPEAESIYFVDGLLLRGEGRYVDLAEPVRSALIAPTGPMFYALRQIDLELEIRKKSTYLLVGSRNFRSPGGLGPVRSDSCYIAVLNSAIAQSIQNRFKNRPGEVVAGQKVWEWQTRGERSVPWTYFIAQTAEREVLVSTSLSYLRTILVRKREGRSDGFSQSKEYVWKEVSSASPTWAVRRYRQTGMSKSDRQAAGLIFADGVEIDQQAIALTLSVSPDAQKVAVRYLSGGSGDQVTGAWIRDGLAVTKLMKGRWEIQLDLSDREKDMVRLLELLLMLGYGVFI